MTAAVGFNRQYRHTSPADRGDIIGDTPGTWADQAACLGHSHLFYPTPYEAQLDRQRRHRDALAICGRCPVAVDCLTFATNTKEQHGIWGGRIFDRTHHESRKP